MLIFAQSEQAFLCSVRQSSCSSENENSWDPEQFYLFALVIAMSEIDVNRSCFFHANPWIGESGTIMLLSLLSCTKATMCFPKLKTISTCGPDYSRLTYGYRDLFLSSLLEVAHHSNLTIFIKSYHAQCTHCKIFYSDICYFWHYQGYITLLMVCVSRW